MTYIGPLRRTIRDAEARDAIKERDEARRADRRRSHYGPGGAFWNNGPEFPFTGDAFEDRR